MSELEPKKEPHLTDSCIIHYINEKSQDEFEKSEVELRTGSDKTQVEIIKADLHDQTNYYGQTPYYQEQQRVGGRPVYVQAGPQPINVRDTPAYQLGRQSRFEDEFEPDNTFSDRTVRNGFVRKVYTLLSLQLLLTFGFILLCSLVKEIKEFMLEYYYLVFVAFIAEMVVACALMCSTTLRRTTPTNFILLAVFTLMFAYCFGFISIFYSTQIILLAIGITFVICVGITIFAIRTAWDVTTYGLYLFVILLIVFVFGLVVTIIHFFTSIPLLHAVYSALIGLVFCMYLVYDTQQIIGGRRIQLSPEEYIMGALQLYIDVMYIFLAILRILGCINQ